MNVCVSVSRPVSGTYRQPENNVISHSVSQSVSQSVSHSVSQSVSPSVGQSVSEVDLQVVSVLRLLAAAVVVWQPMLSSCLSISLVVA